MKRRHFLQAAVAAGVASALPGTKVFAAELATLTQVVSDIAAVSGSGAEVALERAAVKELSDSLRGNLLLPGNAGYDIARRVLNESIDRYPALIVQPTGVADIQNAVNFARERDLLLAVKCGGHSYGGKSTCDGGLQIDLSTFRHARVDQIARTAHIAGGSLLAELDREAMAVGLVTTAGTVSHTGVGGLTLGGGFGRLARRFGLALDNVQSVDIVTADGKLRHASADQNPDLYWGVRGGGGNFGVVTNFEFRLHRMQRKVIGGEVTFPIDRARDMLKFYGEFCVSAPDDLYCDAIVMAPPGHADPFAMIHVCYSGPADKAEHVLAPLRKFGKPMNDTIRPTDYVAIQSSWDDSDPRNVGEYLKGGFINEFPGSLADTIMDGFEPNPDRTLMFLFQHSGGAIGRIPVDATAFAHRKSIANMLPIISWSLDTDGTPHFNYLREYWKTLESATDGWYTNEASDEPQRVLNSNYQGNFERLLSIKNKYDPGNLFRLNANISPSA